MAKKLLSLNPDGKLVLKLPDGKVEDIPWQSELDKWVYLLIDCSSSMQGDKILQAKEGTLKFAKDAVSKGYAVGLIEFSSEASILIEPVKQLNFFDPTVERLLARGTTNMTDALVLALDHLRKRDGLRVIVVVTDGMPDHQETALATAQEAKRNTIDIIAIGTTDSDKDFLNKLATRSDLAVQSSSNNLGQSIVLSSKLLPNRKHRDHTTQ
jgi:Mg-chelatase subunit ChlD